jgi:hypothetical protein
MYSLLAQLPDETPDFLLSLNQRRRIRGHIFTFAAVAVHPEMVHPIQRIGFGMLRACSNALGKRQREKQVPRSRG